MNLLDKLKINHRPRSGALDLLKYIGPGLLVTVGFIDPGNWATNLAAGSEFGYALLWVDIFLFVLLFFFFFFLLIIFLGSVVELSNTFIVTLSVS